MAQYVKKRGALTQKKAAELLGYCPEYLNRVIRGKLTNPKLLADYNFLVARATELKPPTPNTPIPTP